MQDGARPEPVHDPSAQAGQFYSYVEQIEMLDEVGEREAAGDRAWAVGEDEGSEGKRFNVLGDVCVEGVRMGEGEGREMEGWEVVGGGPGGHVTRRGAVAD